MDGYVHAGGFLGTLAGTLHERLLARPQCKHCQEKVQMYLNTHTPALESLKTHFLFIKLTSNKQLN